MKIPGMLRPVAATTSVDRAFDDFLQAPVDEDRKEKLLSVLSALARLDLDPWREAAELTELSREKATQRLASLIATLPEASPTVQRNPATIAARLVALLPTKVQVRPLEKPPQARFGASLKTIAFGILYVLFVISMVAGRYFDGPQPLVPSFHGEAASPLTVNPP